MHPTSVHLRGRNFRLFIGGLLVEVLKVQSRDVISVEGDGKWGEVISLAS